MAESRISRAGIISDLPYAMALPLLLFFLLGSDVQAQWQEEVRLTNAPDSARTSYTNAWNIATDGDVVHIVWQDKRNGNWQIFYRRSLDGGVNWENYEELSTNYLDVAKRPSIAVSGSDVHVVWQDERDGHSEIYYRHSTNEGTSWGDELRLTDELSGSWVPSIAVSGMTVHVTWSDLRGGYRDIYYKRSDDCGQNWCDDIPLTENRYLSESSCIAVSGSYVHVVWYDYLYGNSEIHYRNSTDGGRTWCEEIRLTVDPGVSNGTSVAASGSDVHVVWHDLRTGAWDVHYLHSTDNGMTWDDDTPLTLTLWACYFPSIVLSGSKVHIVWVDERFGVGNIFYKCSPDEGESWGEDIPLTIHPWKSRYPFVSVSGPVIHVVWTGERDGNRKIFYKRNPTGNLTEIRDENERIPLEYALSQNYPNPFNPGTRIKYSIPATTHVLLTVHDLFGRRIQTLYDGVKNAGNHEAAFHADGLAGGLYLYRLQAGDASLSKMMTLIK